MEKQKSRKGQRGKDKLLYLDIYNFIPNTNILNLGL